MAQERMGFDRRPLNPIHPLNPWSKPFSRSSQFATTLRGACVLECAAAAALSQQGELSYYVADTATKAFWRNVDDPIRRLSCRLFAGWNVRVVSRRPPSPTAPAVWV